MIETADIKSVRDFYMKFCPTEEKACEIYEEIRWGDKLVCPFCESDNIYRMKNKTQPYKCGDCKHKYSVKSRSIMQGSNIPVQQWLYALYVMRINCKGISSIKLSKELGITQKSAWYMAQKIRECYIENNTLENVVEMDETFIGGKEKNKHANKKHNSGRGTAGKQAVMGAIERGTGQVVAYPVHKVNAETIGNFIDKNIEQNTAIIADDFGGYSAFTDLRVKHSTGEYVNGDIHTNNIESYWAIVKRGQMGVYHWWSRKHLPKYMNEFSYRFNRRDIDNVKFIAGVIKNGIGKVKTFKDIRA